MTEPTHWMVEVDHRLIEALQAREQQLAEAQRLAHTGSWDWELASDTMEWSDELYRILGLRREATAPTYGALLATLPADERSSMEAVLTRPWTSFEPWVLHHRIVRPDGEVRHVEGRGELILDGGGVPVRMHGTIRDRTDAELLLRHFRTVSAAFDLIGAASAAVQAARDTHEALCAVLDHVARNHGWIAARAWRARGPGGDLEQTDASWGATRSGWDSPSPLGIAALTTREPQTSARPGHDAVDPAQQVSTVIAVPVMVSGDVAFVLEFDGHGGSAPDDIAVSALESVCSSLSKRLEAEEDLSRLAAESESRFATLVRHTSEAVAVLDLDGTILYSTPATARLFGYGDGTRVGTSALDLIHPDDRAEVRTRLRFGPAARTPAEVVELRVAHSDGSWRAIEVSRTSVTGDAHVRGAVVVNLRDVTEERRAQQGERDALSHDQLTGLSTRPVFVEQVRRAVGHPGRHGLTVVHAVDIDEFRRVNEMHGYETGDRVLATVAERLRSPRGAHDLLARVGAITRLGGDEFLLMCDGVPDEASAEAIAARILDEIAAPIVVSTGRIVLSASAGLAVSAGPASPEQMILDAESAQREAKASGGGRHRLFTAALQARAMSTVMTDSLTSAIEAEQFRLVYQPKISLATNRIVGVEALVRWDHPERGLVMPGDFIRAAEASGSVVPLGGWVLRKAARQAAAWRVAFPRLPLQLSVNVSARQFRTGLATTIRDAIADAGVDAGAICLEMTETTVMEDIDSTVGILDELKALGFTVSIDDFGTGYSSLEYLHRMPIDEVKIDRSFVAGLGVDSVNTAIVASVISLAHAMNLEVVAEGVETVDQLERLRTLGCDFAQGYAIARPLPVEELDGLLAADVAGQALPLPGPVVPIARSSVAETVLVVDDAADVRMLATMSLTAAGFTVEEAGDGAAALAVARRIVPDCVLLDVAMPDMTGIEVCRALRRDPATSGCTIVILTTHADAADKAEAFLAGADDYIVKPFAPRELVARMRSALRRRQNTVGTVGRRVDAALLEMLRATRGDGHDANAAADEPLSDRHLEILKRILGGERVSRIARDLAMSRRTVRNHLGVVYQRLGVRSREELLTRLRRKSAELTN